MLRFYCKFIFKCNKTLLCDYCSKISIYIYIYIYQCVTPAFENPDVLSKGSAKNRDKNQITFVIDILTFIRTTNRSINRARFCTEICKILETGLVYLNPECFDFSDERRNWPFLSAYSWVMIRVQESNFKNLLSYFQMLFWILLNGWTRVRWNRHGTGMWLGFREPNRIIFQGVCQSNLGP